MATTNDDDWAGAGFGPLPDNGTRKTGPGGYQKEQHGKPSPTLIPTFVLKRLAVHMSLGANKYGRDNWMDALTHDEWVGFRDAAFRHFIQWLDGEGTEDHFSAVVFNMWCAEHVKGKLDAASD